MSRDTKPEVESKLIPASLRAHVSDYLELTGSWIGDGAHGGGCETLARITLDHDRLIISRPHLVAAINEAEQRGFQRSFDQHRTAEVLAEAEQRGYDRALVELNATAESIANMWNGPGAVKSSVETPEQEGARLALESPNLGSNLYTATVRKDSEFNRLAVVYYAAVKGVSK